MKNWVIIWSTFAAVFLGLSIFAFTLHDYKGMCYMLGGCAASLGYIALMKWYNKL